MYEMTYLTEDDMPYFRKQAEEGRVVLIEIDPSALKKVDIEKFRLKSGEIDQDLLERELKEKSASRKKRAEKNKEIMRGNEQMKEALNRRTDSDSEKNTVNDRQEDLTEIMSQIILSDAQWSAVSYAMDLGLSDGELKAILHDDLSPERMKRLADSFARRKKGREVP